MALVLRLSTNKRKLLVTINPGVKAIIVKGEINLETFRDANGLAPVEKTIPDEVDVVDTNGEKITALQEGEGAPVCYWVGGNLVCW